MAQMSAVVVFILLVAFALYAQTSVSISPDENTLIIENAKESDVFSFGKTVIVKQQAKGVLAFGGDIIVEGRVDGDVATIGGSVIQKETAFIGGDVITFGGTYRHESANPLRNAGRETIMYAGYEEELRNLTQNPSQIFAPSFSWAFLAQRVLSLLFWFVISLAVTTIAPGAISRAVARFQLSKLKIFAVGSVGFLITTISVTASLSFLPNYVSAIASLMAFVLLLLGYVFGRVALQVSVGKQLQKRLLPNNNHSETFALLIGTFV
ncbi:MAG: polymer-forming cytoskeletal protein, partial [Acidobacteriota bacterium]|nr:polymer-forming cytoskeletal protein [Acidobacteriota bacterium]